MPPSSYGDTKSTEQLAKSSGSNASKESARRGIGTELRVRIGGDLMVDFIEIAKPLTRLKSIPHAIAAISAGQSALSAVCNRQSKI
jgi:hypothetical protein